MENHVPYAVTRIALACAVLAATGTAFAAPAPGACSIMSKAEVKPFSSNQFFDQFPAEEDKAGGGTGCNYAGVYIQLDPFPFATVENMRRQPGQTLESAPGIGNAAYVRDNGGNYAELYARVGQRVFTIQMSIRPGESFASVKPRLLQMGTAMAAKLR